MFQKIALVAMVGAGIAGGALWPRGEAEPGPSAGATHEVTLDRSRDGHFYVTADVNGKPVRFLVDTGASTVALSEADAQAVGLEVNPAEFEYLGDGAAGMVRGKQVRLATVAVGDIAQQDVDAAVVANADVSLLGTPFLNQLDEIVIRKSEMTFRKSS